MRIMLIAAMLTAGAAHGQGLPVQMPLTASSVTTGGTAVTAIAAGNRLRGGWLFNPSSATVELCINEISTASGTVSSGSTTCIAVGMKYDVVPSTAAVSVISSVSGHTFSGMGLK